MSLTHLWHVVRRAGDWPLLTCGLGFVLLLAATALSAAEEPPSTKPASSLAARVEHLNILRERVAQLQNQQGQYDPGLLNAMNGLSEALISVGEFREANDVVEQQIQILRVTDGLYTDGQIALVHRQLSIMAAQRN